MLKKKRIPWNKGTKGICKPTKTSFKKGEHTGKNHWHWKNGRKKTKNGYIQLRMPFHPFCNKDGYIYEHRIVVEKHLRRYLKLHEVVHHLDGNRANNQIRNLKLFSSNKDHYVFHMNYSGNYPNHKLNNNDILKIREMAKKMNHDKISRKSLKYIHLIYLVLFLKDVGNTFKKLTYVLVC